MYTIFVVCSLYVISSISLGSHFVSVLIVFYSRVPLLYCLRYSFTLEYLHVCVSVFAWGDELVCVFDLTLYCMLIVYCSPNGHTRKPILFVASR